MFNLYQIISGAQGGQAIDNLAQQFGLSRDEADSAIKSLVPALSTAFTTKAMQPGGMRALAGAMTDDQHKQAYVDPDAAHDPQTQQKGGAVAGDIFGNTAIVQQVLRQASAYTHIPIATLEQMLPVIVSMVMGGVATAMRDQGMGGWLGQLADSGLGGLFGPMGNQAGGQAAGAGLGGLFGSILSGVLGGSQTAGMPNGGAAGSADPGGTGMPPAMRAGMEALGKMFQPGVSSSGAQPDDLGDQISSILGGKKA